MIRFIKGVFHPGFNGSIIVETNSGLGLEVNVPSNSTLYKNLEGEEIKVFTSMMVREDDISLYGFSDKDAMELFEKLITVNGIGAKAGMALMSALTPNELKRAIAAGDVKAISSANGVGKKTAERLILELKDKVGAFEGEDVSYGEADYSGNDERSEAIAALMSLGYSKNEAQTAIGKVREQDLSCEEYIKKALKDLF